MQKIRAAASFVVSVALLHGAGVCAQDYPVKSVRVVVPSPPGGITDLVTRIVTTKMIELSGHTVVVDNRSGASTNIGMEVVARAPGDGYTLLANTLPLVVNPSVFKKLPFNVQRDFAPVSQLTSAPYVLVTHPSLPVKSMKDLIVLGRTHPYQLNYSSGGAGTNLHMAAALFEMLARVPMTHLPYRGGGPALTSVVAGEAGLSFPSLATVLPYVRAGRLNAIGITTTTRSPLLPEVPTIVEAGVKHYEFTSWVGVLAPASTPPHIVNAAHALFVKAIRSPDVAARLKSDGTEIVASSPAEFGAYLKEQIARWAHVVEVSGIKPD
jgi:tripartite-type tricarboxylate transporter receptor subunit TctC